MKIMKFGGTSVGSGKKILNAAKIIKSYLEKEKIIVVVSAMSSVTDSLIEIFNKYKEKDFSSALRYLNNLYQKHLLALEELSFEKEKYLEVKQSLDVLFGQLLSRLTFNNNHTDCDYDYVVSFGEKFSCVLLASALQLYFVRSKAVFSDRFVITTNEFGNARVILSATEKKAKDYLLPLLCKRIVPVVTGYFGVTKNGAITTLGRGGSDYSATALAYALDASSVILWKEVDGVYTKDPKKNGDGKFLPQLSYIDALILAKNGAKILHPEAIKPVQKKEIVVWVKNTFRPEYSGTKIWKGE